MLYLNIDGEEVELSDKEYEQLLELSVKTAKSMEEILLEALE